MNIDWLRKLKIRIAVEISFDFVNNVPKPSPVTINSKKELDMARFGYTFTLPEPGAKDVTQRELRATVNGGEPQITTLPGDARATEQIVFNQDDAVSISLVDIDDVGNRSTESEALTFNVNDDVPPPTPGGLAVANKTEID